jgi:hypothetical protein
MKPSNLCRFFVASLLASAALAQGGAAIAQVTPAGGYTPADDTPTIKVGTTIFADYTYQGDLQPPKTDADGNTINPSSFNISRAYINITGNLSHLVSFRVTPDIKQDTTAGDTLNGSYVFRLKYAYGQYNLDGAWSKGSWVKFGVHHTPYVDWEEGIYRYRFQGQIFAEKAGRGYLSSSDAGISTHYNFPSDFGDVHVGYYNGDTYTKAEPNDQKAIQIRATLRPAPTVGVLKGLRLTAFYDSDHYIKDDARRRFIYTATFEHKYVNAGYEHLDATDQPTGVSPEVKANGYTVWVVPRSTKGWEGLLRYDSLKPDKDGVLVGSANKDAMEQRKIAGIAYWFHTQQPSGAAAVLLDYENTTRDSAINIAPLVPAATFTQEKRYAVHMLFNY